MSVEMGWNEASAQSNQFPCRFCLRRLQYDDRRQLKGRHGRHLGAQAPDEHVPLEQQGLDTRKSRT